MMVIDDPIKFAAFTEHFLSNGQIDQKYTDLYGNTNYKIYNIKENGLSANNEVGFVKFLSDQKSGLKILKGSNKSNNWEELGLKDGNIIPKPCN
ncbi:hypothetical protein IX38_20495 [Chryseobacterium luteum]|uniref:Uncharacterized protein n=2 Tax=Chryseobacterium luteum TaxID=421531 RepID=A0A085YYV5_9FLAO|nr:hypothetical protein IX38_20495 [Chryseobacterium luteum]